MAGKITITSVAPTVCKLMGIEKPKMSTSVVFDELIHKAADLGIGKIEKCLVFAPDAIGAFLQKDYQDYFIEVRKYAPITVPLSSVYIPVTPVCFASMFTGALPEIHGIQKYERPVVKIDTLFDRLIESHKNPAIVAVENSSNDLIFRNRKMDYYPEKYDDEVIIKTTSLLKADKNDFILSYNQEYDDCIHKTTPCSKESINALKNQNENFVKLAKAFDKYWKRYNRAILYTPDHGCHIEKETGKGNHCLDIPEDMNVLHFCGIAKAGERLAF